MLYAALVDSKKITKRKNPEQTECIHNITFSGLSHREEVVVCDRNEKGNICKIVNLLD